MLVSFLVERCQRCIHLNFFEGHSWSSSTSHFARLILSLVLETLVLLVLHSVFQPLSLCSAQGSNLSHLIFALCQLLLLLTSAVSLAFRWLEDCSCSHKAGNGSFRQQRKQRWLRNKQAQCREDEIERVWYSEGKLQQICTELDVDRQKGERAAQD